MPNSKTTKKRMIMMLWRLKEVEGGFRVATREAFERVRRFRGELSVVSDRVTELQVCTPRPPGKSECGTRPEHR